MNWTVLIIVVLIVAVAWFVFGKRDQPGSSTSQASPPLPPAPPPPAPRPAPPPPAPAPVARPAAPVTAPVGASAASSAGSPPAAPAASYDAYRQTAPSNMINGRLTCNRCGSNRVSTVAGIATCGSCGAGLYRDDVSAASTGAGGIADSYEAYRQAAPSNMVNGKVTCTTCGSNRISSAGGVAACGSCGAELYRHAAGATASSYDAYRDLAPSNLINGRVTCNRCGSNAISTVDGVATCDSCGAKLYRA